MKAALVLHAESRGLPQDAGSLKQLLECAKGLSAEPELWLVHQGQAPEAFPDMERAVSAIRLICLPDPYPSQAWLDALQKMAAIEPQDMYLFAGDSLGEELATRLAFRLKGSSCLQVEGLWLEERGLVAQKPAYNSHMQAKLALRKTPYCISVARTPAPPAKISPAKCPITRHDSQETGGLDWFKRSELIPDQPLGDLKLAKVVLAVGQGVGGRDKLNEAKAIAESLGMELGASRPVVMNAWVGMERMIGASGLVLSPGLCLAAGVSGSAAFSVGIKSSGFVVAINQDPQAPIFRLAKVGVEAEMMGFLRELSRVANEDRQGNRRPLASDPDDNHETG
jgi:electron transfer flavoprotein alpha subunit